MRENGSALPQYEGFVGGVLQLMEDLGEWGVGLAVFLENFIPPIPSEAVLPGAGFLAYEGRMNVLLVWAAATVGSMLGAWLWYAVGALLGGERTRRAMGAIPLMSVADYDRAERWFRRYGVWAVLVGRCIPLVRTFISIPAGIARMGLASFTLFTVLGSGVWNGIWIGAGFAAGPAIRPLLERFSGVLSTAVLIVAALAVVWFVAVRVRRRRGT